MSIAVRNRTHKFELEFHGKFNFITGNSGDNKTHFVNVCRKRKRKVSRVTGNFKIGNENLNLDRVFIYTNEDDMEEEFYRNALLSRHNSLFIIDEFCGIFKIHDIASLLLRSDNYFVFVTRKIFGYLLVSVMAVYRLKNSGSNRYVNENIFSKLNTKNFGRIDYILTEDGEAGRNSFKYNFPKIKVCDHYGTINNKILSRDNSQLHRFLIEDMKSKDNILVVYDSSVYAPFMTSLLNVLRIADYLNKNVQVLDWESFETYVLSLPMFSINLTLEDTKCGFNSLEKMSEIKLAELINYNKSVLLTCLKMNTKCESCKSFKECKFKDDRNINQIIISPLDTIKSLSNEANKIDAFL